MALIELRDYHYKPDRLDEFRTWPVEAHRSRRNAPYPGFEDYLQLSVRFLEEV